ncbi:MAG: GNAT family N-acetyltransferase [Firmicutes bacterium]|nr:GNAT family N-acetyltransferase [Bacillota bacterium]
MGRHLGYSIRPKERSKGKGTALLNLALEYCYSLGIDPVLVSFSKENTASRKLVEKCGGVYEYSVQRAKDSGRHLVYSFCAKPGIGGIQF